MAEDQIEFQESPYKTFPKTILKVQNGSQKAEQPQNQKQFNWKQKNGEGTDKKQVSFKDTVTKNPSNLVQTKEVESYKEYNQENGTHSHTGNSTGCSCSLL